MIKYWELLSTSVSVKQASCDTVCARVRRCLYNKFSGALIGDWALIQIFMVCILAVTGGCDRLNSDQRQTSPVKL